MVFPKSLPRPRIPDQDRVPRLRWGVGGPGWIAERFVSALKAHTRHLHDALAAISASLRATPSRRGRASLAA